MPWILLYAIHAWRCPGSGHIRGIICKGRFVQGPQHPRTFGRGHIGRGHINPVSGSTYPDHEVRPWKYPITYPPRRQVTECWVPPTPPPPFFPPFRGVLGRDPPPPSTEHTPSPGKLPSRIDLGENLVSASKSGSEVTVRAQDDRVEHFWLNGISLRGQTAELETSAG